MITEQATATALAVETNETLSLERTREAGRAVARSHVVDRRHRPHLPAPTFVPELLQKRGERAVLENLRLIRTAAKEVRDFDRGLRRHPGVADASGRIVPRAYAVSREYLDAVNECFSEATLTEFLSGYQEIAELEMGELWALRPALQFVLLERLIEGGGKSEPRVESLRLVAEAPWKHLFEAVSLPDLVLARDPAGAYTAMDYESRDAYRNAVSALAKHSQCCETAVAAAAVELAASAAESQLGVRATERRRHVGFYLLDKGVRQLRQRIGYRAPISGRIRTFALDNATGFYLLGVEVLTFLTVVGLLSGLDTLTPIVAGMAMLLLPATQAAVDFMNNLVAYLVRPRTLPKLDFSEAIPEDCATMVAVPTLLLNERQVQNLVLDLEIRYLANRDPNVYFALLTDSPDADAPRTESDGLVETCSGLIEGLNQRYSSDGHIPFLLLHRHHIYNPSEGRWMGWERKRGKLIDLNQLLRGAYDGFPVKVGDTSVFPRIRYVITLDSDTQLPRDAAAKLIGTLAHPLNRAVIHPTARMVVEGYGILQPRIGISIESATRSRLASLYSGQTGFDIYTRAVSDVYQDLFGEGIFTGKGIYEVDVFREVLERRFPENTLLSHDLIEGAYARAGLVTDIELIDDYPSHFSAYSRRKHRWVRGDWQIMRWMRGRVPDYDRELIPNPISLISQWKIFDNLRRSLIEPATLLLLLAGWFYLPGEVWYWTVASLVMLFMPVYSNLLFSVLRAPWGWRALRVWARETAGGFVKGNVVTLLAGVFLLHQALLSLDAVVRSMMRLFLTHRKLLEWETAAEAETQARRKATVDIYLEWTPVIAALIGVLVWRLRPEALPVALPWVALWFLSRGISALLNRAPRTRNPKLDWRDQEFLRDCAERMWRFYREWSTPANHWLIPDNVCEDGAVAQRLSPTNAGLLLNARVAAVHFGLIGLPEFAFETRKTLETLTALPKHRGHLLNWYDIEALEPLEPRFVSTVDSGNLAACLWTLKQAALAFAERQDADSETKAILAEIAETSDQLVKDMDFTFLYQRRKKVLSVGYNVNAQRLEPSSYDLLASESRIASFVAIAKGDIPKESWFHLGRGHTLFRGQRVLLSWTGTMFEYLMPALWMQQYSGTITSESINAVVRAQREYSRGRGVPWGISESGCAAEGTVDYGYAPFGVPALAMKSSVAAQLVISPYSSFLALPVELNAAVENLRRMERSGWTGRYGFYEAADYSAGDPELVRSWMAHHQGMSLLATCNVLYGDPMRKYFHAEPRVMATELLLHERVPAAVEPDVLPEPAVVVLPVKFRIPGAVGVAR
jgi:hypothetical protein